MFHVIDKEMQWRRKLERLEGFGTLRKHKPVVAVGAEKPLNDQIMMADYFRLSPRLNSLDDHTKGVDHQMAPMGWVEFTSA